MKRPIAALFLAGLAISSAAAATAELKAPTQLYHEPQSYLLLPLYGDRVTVRYIPGALDRAARLQHRLELTMRTFTKATGTKIDLEVYLLTRQEWQESRYQHAYGLPIRVGHHGLAAPAEGDEGTVALWTELLEGVLPQIVGTPLRGTPQQAATMALADFLAQLEASEILVDDLGLVGDAPWIRGLTAHIAALEFFRRFEPARLSDLESMYSLVTRDQEPRAMSARDYNLDLGLHDWFWFQAQFHAGAQVVLDQAGKGALKKLNKFKKKDGTIRSERLFKQFKGLEDWFRDRFATVSLRTH